MTVTNTNPLHSSLRSNDRQISHLRPEELQTQRNAEDVELLEFIHNVFLQWDGNYFHGWILEGSYLISIGYRQIISCFCGEE